MRAPYNFGFIEGSPEETAFIGTLEARPWDQHGVIVRSQMSGKRYEVMPGKAIELYRGKETQRGPHWFVCAGCDGPNGHLFACGDAVLTTWFHRRTSLNWCLFGTTGISATKEAARFRERYSIGGVTCQP